MYLLDIQKWGYAPASIITSYFTYVMCIKYKLYNFDLSIFVYTFTLKRIEIT